MGSDPDLQSPSPLMLGRGHRLKTPSVRLRLYVTNSPSHRSSFPPSSSESTCLVQKKRSSYGSELGLVEKVVMDGKIDEGCEPESSPKIVIVKECSSRKNKRKDRVDLVLERAQACLEKIRCLKTSLLPPPS